ncbi:MAG TPA: hypothetical protein PLU24_01635, partial [Candidatus Omnitrophota bacterium]|nr:hypothetical protein [Candidatus Omnitrophota bacterium]
IGIDVTYYMDELESPIVQTEQKPAQPEPDTLVPSLSNETPKTPDTSGVEFSPPKEEGQKPASVTNPSATVKTDTVTGEIHGLPFVADKVELKNNILELIQGKEFFPDLGLTIFLFGPETGKTWEDGQVHVTGESIGLKPHIHVKWKVAGQKMNETKIYISGYDLDLSLGVIKDGKIKGNIDLVLSDGFGTHISGPFEADVKSSPSKGGATVTIEKDGKKITRPMTGWEKAVFAGTWGAFFIFMLIVHVIMCIPFYLISKKTGIGVSFFSFIPLLNIFLMIELARKPAYSFLGLFIPIYNIYVTITIFCGIAETCRVPEWTGLMVMVPFFNVFLPWYFLYGLNEAIKK